MNNQGTLVIAPIRPQSDNDTYPVAFASEIAGGLQAVQDIAGRDNIPPERREIGMIVYDINDDVVYMLKNGIDNTNWTVLIPAGGLVTALAHLTDVNLSTIGDGDVLSYSTALSKWVNITKVSIVDGGTW